MDIMALHFPLTGLGERKLSGSFMLTSELTRQELSEQINRVRPDSQRRESTTPYVTSINADLGTEGSADSRSEYSKTLARLDFYYLMGEEIFVEFCQDRDF